MKALLILAHGSRRDESNKEVEQLTKMVREQSIGEYDEITHAFLELAEPDMHSAVSLLVGKGAQTIMVLPYFLNSGNHVSQDIPDLIEQAKDMFPDCNFHVTKPIGMHEDMPALLLQCAKQTIH